MNYRRLKEQNSAFVQDDLFHHNEEWRGLPEVVNLNHTDICNLRCIMCFESVTPGTKRIPMPRVREILAQVLPAAKKLKLTTAGEPLLLDFEELVELAREYQVRLSMITNGTHLTVERYLKMKDVLEHITLSLDSHDRDVFTKIRGRGAYDKIMANLRALGEATAGANHVFHIHMILMRSNLEAFPGFIPFAKSLGVHVVKVLRLHFPFAGLMEKEDIFGDFPAEVRDKYVNAAIAEAKRLGVNLIVEELGYENVEHHWVPPTYPPRPQTYICSMMAQEVFINPSEQVYPCCMPSEHLMMGDLKKQSFRDIWNGPNYRKLRREMFSQKLHPYCANCKIYAPFPTQKSFELFDGGGSGPLGLIRKKVKKMFGQDGAAGSAKTKPSRNAVPEEKRPAAAPR